MSQSGLNKMLLALRLLPSRERVCVCVSVLLQLIVSLVSPVYTAAAAAATEIGSPRLANCLCAERQLQQQQQQSLSGCGSRSGCVVRIC